MPFIRKVHDAPRAQGNCPACGFRSLIVFGDPAIILCNNVECRTPAMLSGIMSAVGSGLRLRKVSIRKSSRPDEWIVSTPDGRTASSATYAGACELAAVYIHSALIALGMMRRLGIYVNDPTIV